MKKKLLLAAILIAAIVLLASCQTTKPETFCEIKVKGMSSVNVEPDIVEFSVRVSETAPTTGEAQQLANAKVSQILAIFDSFGIEKKDISTGSLSFSTDYYWDKDGKQQFAGERVSQQITASLRDLPKFPALADELGTQLTGISLNSVSFDREDKAQFYDQAREKAIEDARAKAEIYAKASGLELAEPISISESSSYVVTNNRIKAYAMGAAPGAEEAASAQTEVPAGEIVITSSIEVVYKAK